MSHVYSFSQFNSIQFTESSASFSGILWLDDIETRIESGSCHSQGALGSSDILLWIETRIESGSCHPQRYLLGFCDFSSHPVCVIAPHPSIRNYVSDNALFRQSIQHDPNRPMVEVTPGSQPEYCSPLGAFQLVVRVPEDTLGDVSAVDLPSEPARIAPRVGGSRDKLKTARDTV